MEHMSYFLPSDLNKITSCTTKPTSFKAIHLNVRSVKNKTMCLEEFFGEFSFTFSLVMLTETWSTNDSDTFTMTHYKTYSLNRSSQRGGGVALLVSNNIECDKLDSYSLITDDFEIISVCTGQFVFSVCYRPPKGNALKFFQFYDNFLSFITDSKYTLIAGGDFNIDLLKDNYFAMNFNTTLASNGFVNLIKIPTRVTPEGASLLDLLITNSSQPIAATGVITCAISDHLPVFLSINKIPAVKYWQEKAAYQRITNQTLSLFYNSITQVQWDATGLSNDANEAYDKFLYVFKQLYHSCFPLKVRGLKRKTRKPWVTIELREEIKTKDKLFKVFLNTRSADDLKVFKKYRNRLTKKLRKARAEYYSTLLEVKNGRHDLLWSRLNLLLRREQPQASLRMLKLNDKDISGVELAEVFNNFFTTLAHNSPSDDSNKYINSFNNDTIFLSPVTTEEVIAVLQNLKNSHSCDIDGIQVRPVKHVAAVIAPTLADIFNLCLDTGTFPKQMQVAKVTVLYKKGDRNDLGNYRPVSILPIFSKVFEKVLYTRLYDFINKHSLLSPNQFGFCKNKSAELALLEQKEYILTQFEKKAFVIGIFVDFSKAFDLVNHTILLQNLECYGIRGQAQLLLKSYLSHRKQAVCIDNIKSELKSVTCGVPQGSILGPLLFNMYLNDICNINTTAKFIIYADDTSIFFTGNNLDILVRDCNDTMSELQKWSESKCMRINEKKTQAVVFRPKNKPVPFSFGIKLNSRCIDVVEQFKCLGVVFSSSMSWEQHVDHISTKLAQITGIVGRLKYVLPKPIKLLLYNSLFYSYLNYCHLVWGTTTPGCLQRIYILQKRFLRHVHNVPWHSPSADLFLQSNVIKIENLYKFRLSVRFQLETLKNINHLRYLADLHARKMTFMTRHGESWVVPTPRINLGRQRLQFTLPSLLNSYLHSGFDLFSSSKNTLRAMYVNM